MIFFIPYRLHLFQLSLNICNAQSCLSPHVSQHHESWSPKILPLLGTSSSLLQMGLLVLPIRISHKSDLNHFVVMTNMMSKLSAPLQNNTMLGLEFGYAPIIKKHSRIGVDFHVDKIIYLHKLLQPITKLNLGCKEGNLGEVEELLQKHFVSTWLKMNQKWRGSKVGHARGSHSKGTMKLYKIIV